MSKKDEHKQIRIPLPKWNWWQTGCVISMIIIAIRLPLDGSFLETLKTIAKLFLSG